MATRTRKVRSNYSFSNGARVRLKNDPYGRGVGTVLGVYRSKIQVHFAKTSIGPVTSFVSPSNLEYANPLDPNTRVLITGAALAATAVAIASLLVAKKATASTTTTTTTGQAVALDASNAKQLEAVNVGDTVTISLEANASQGFGWPEPSIAPAGILSGPTRSTSTTGISDTFQVIGPGSATVTYLESTPNGASIPTVFPITAAAT